MILLLKNIIWRIVGILLMSNISMDSAKVPKCQGIVAGGSNPPAKT